MFTQNKSKILLILSMIVVLSLSALAAANPLDHYDSGSSNYDYYESDGSFDYYDGGSNFDYYDGSGSNFDYYDNSGSNFDYYDEGSVFDYYDNEEGYYDYPEDGEDTYGGDFFEPEPYEPDMTPPFDDPEEDIPGNYEDKDDEDDEPEPGFEPEPDDDDDEPLPNQPARWLPLENQKIPQGSADYTIVYPRLAMKCMDPDDPFVMTVLSKFMDFNLVFSGLDLVIRDLKPGFTGTNKIELSCNGIGNSFYLTVYPVDGGDSDDECKSSGVHISNIRILSDDYEIHPGEEIGIKTRISNNGNRRLEGVKLTAVIQELGIRRSEGPFDLKSGNGAVKTVYLDIPEYVESGWYYIRITLSGSNGEAKRIVHREVFIGEQSSLNS